MPEETTNTGNTPPTPVQAETVGQTPQQITSGASEGWVKEQIETAKKEVKEEAEKAIREQVQMDKASLITVFGIFASVISFLTIEFQFLKTLCSLEKILGFTLMLFALLFGFNVALDYLVKSRLDKETPRPNLYFIFIVALLFCVGIVFSFKGNEEVCKDNKIYQRYSDQFEATSGERLQEMDNKLDFLNLKIKSFELMIQNIKNK